MDEAFIVAEKYDPAGWRRKDYWVLKNLYLNTDEPKEEKKMTTNKLYEIKQGLVETLYGHKLAVNSQGQWVMEIKGTGAVIAVNKDAVQEVLPHTVAVQFESTKTTYHYLAEKGSVEKGAFYITDTPYGRSIIQVIDVDTKSTRAATQLNVLAKIKTE